MQSLLLKNANKQRTYARGHEGVTGHGFRDNTRQPLYSTTGHNNWQRHTVYNFSEGKEQGRDEYVFRNITFFPDK